MPAGGRKRTTVAKVLLLVALAPVFEVLLAAAQPAGAEGDLGRKLPLEAIEAKTIEWVQVLEPNATPIFARHFDRPLLRAVADREGRFVLVLGGRSADVVGLSPAGDVLWRHELCSGPHGIVTPYPDFLDAGQNGAALCICGLSEEHARHLLIGPEGRIALDDSLHSPGDGGCALALSPCGKYFYPRLQGADEIELREVLGATAADAGLGRIASSGRQGSDTRDLHCPRTGLRPDRVG